MQLRVFPFSRNCGHRRARRSCGRSPFVGERRRRLRRLERCGGPPFQHGARPSVGPDHLSYLRKRRCSGCSPAPIGIGDVRLMAPMMRLMLLPVCTSGRRISFELQSVTGAPVVSISSGDHGTCSQMSASLCVQQRLIGILPAGQKIAAAELGAGTARKGACPRGGIDSLRH